MHATTIGAAIFALLCLIAAGSGYLSLGEITDPAQLADARGFAAFWAFLGGTGALIAGVACWMARSSKADDEGA